MVHIVHIVQIVPQRSVLGPRLFVLYKADLAQVVNKGSAVAEMGDRGHNRHGLKIGNCAAVGEGELGPHLTQCRLDRGLPPYKVAT